MKANISGDSGHSWEVIFIMVKLFESMPSEYTCTDGDGFRDCIANWMLPQNPNLLMWGFNNICCFSSRE